MTTRELASCMFEDACHYEELPETMTTEDAAYNIECYRQEGWTLPAGITPETYAEAWNDLVFDRKFRVQEANKMAEMADALTSIERIMRRVRPDKKLDIVYARENSQSVRMFTDFQRQYFGIRPREEYVYVFDLETGDLLYTINVTADSVLTAISELMDLLARKF